MKTLTFLLCAYILLVARISWAQEPLIEDLSKEEIEQISQEMELRDFASFDALTPFEQTRIIEWLNENISQEDFDRLRENYFGLSVEEMDRQLQTSGSPSDWPTSISDFKFPFAGIYNNFWNGEVWRITCGYGCNLHKNTWYPSAAWHSVDLVRDDGGVTRGSWVLAPARGRVANAGWRTGYGWVVEMDHGNGFWSIVAHLDCDPNMFTSVGHDLLQGTQIGVAGSSGGNYVPHIHFSVWRYWQTIPLDGISGGARIVHNGRYCSGNAFVRSPTGRVSCR